MLPGANRSLNVNPHTKTECEWGHFYTRTPTDAQGIVKNQRLLPYNNIKRHLSDYTLIIFIFIVCLHLSVLFTIVWFILATPELRSFICKVQLARNSFLVSSNYSCFLHVLWGWRTMQMCAHLTHTKMNISGVILVLLTNYLLAKVIF